jgi:hypothetical protein
MDVMSIIIGLVGGVVVGLVIGMVMAKNKAAVWEERLSATRDKLEKIKSESTRNLEASKSKLKSTEEKLAAAKEEATKFKGDAATSSQAAEAHKGQAEQAQASLQQLEAERTKVTEMAEAQKQARQQAEGRCKQAEALTSQVQQQVKQLETQLQTVNTDMESIQQTVDRRTKEVQRLRAEVSSGGGAGLDESMEAFAETDGTLEGVLKVLLDNEGQQAAVLADTNGIVISGLGQTDLKDGMAATAQLIGSIIKQLDGMVPFGILRSYYIQDDQTNVIAGRAFICAGETVSLVTYGPRIPSERVLDGARANLGAILE